MLASFSRRTILLAALLAVSAGAHAQQPGPGAEARPVPREPAPPAAAPPDDQFTASEAPLLAAGTADDAQLERLRGGDDRTTIDTRFTGAVNGNSATNVSTGWNVIEGGSFANMTGIPIIIQNTGANVLIQNATVINLELH